MPRGESRDWGRILPRALEVVNGYDTLVTLRQVFYRLVAMELLANTSGSYKALSKQLVKARNEGWFPDLEDQGRRIIVPSVDSSPRETLRWAADTFTLDHTSGQEVEVVVGVEKKTMVNQLGAWFGERHVPIVALGGYSSKTYKDEVTRFVERRRNQHCGRPVILIYAGDLDPSGEDIDRDFVAQTGCWAEVRRVAMNREQVDEYDLPVAPGKQTDSRAAGFIARHGELMQVELEALDPTDLRAIYEAAVDELWDADAFAVVIDREIELRAQMRSFATGWRDGPADS